MSRCCFQVVRDHGAAGFEVVAVWLDQQAARRHRDALVRAADVDDDWLFKVYPAPLEPDWRAPDYDAAVFGVPPGPL